MRFSAHLDEEQGSVGGGVAVDVDSSEDNSGNEHHSQNDAHDSACVNRGACFLGRKAAPHTCKKDFS